MSPTAGLATLQRLMDGMDESDDAGSNTTVATGRNRRDLTAPIVRRPKNRPPELPGLPAPSGDVDVAYNDFLPAALQIVNAPPSVAYRAIAYVMCSVIIAAIVFSLFGYLRLFAIAPGQFQARGGSQVVEPREAGQVKSINVTNGDHVNQGDVVVTFDPTSALAAKAIIEAKLGDARAEVLRRGMAVIAAMATNIDKEAPIAWPADVKADVRARQENILRADLSQLAAVITDLRASLSAKETARDKYIANIAAQTALIASRTERTAMHETLATQGWDSRAMVLQSLEPLRQEQVSLATLEGSLNEANAAIPVIKNEITKARDSFIADNTSKLATAERLFADLTQQLSMANLTVANMTMRAPVSGTVQSIAVTSVGQALKVGEQVMQIVPDGAPLEIQAYVLNTDIGFVREGQPAIIKVDTFPYTRYGTIRGRVTRVGADAVTGNFAVTQQKNGATTPTSGKLSVTGAAQQTGDLVFPVTVVPDQTTIKVDGRDVPLTPGMSLVVEIETEQQRIIAYILYPLTRVWRGA